MEGGAGRRARSGSDASRPDGERLRRRRARLGDRRAGRDASAKPSAAWDAGHDTPEHDSLDAVVSDEHAARRSTAAGTADDVAHALEPIVRSLGVRAEADLIVRLHYPGMAFNDAARAVSLFGDRVLPALREVGLASRATRPGRDRDPRSAGRRVDDSVAMQPAHGIDETFGGSTGRRERPPNVRGERSRSAASAAPRTYRNDPSNLGWRRLDGRPTRPDAANAHQGRRGQTSQWDRPAHLPAKSITAWFHADGRRRSSHAVGGLAEDARRHLVGFRREVDARPHAADVRVDRGHRLSEPQARDGGRRVVADPGRVRSTRDRAATRRRVPGRSRPRRGGARRRAADSPDDPRRAAPRPSTRPPGSPHRGTSAGIPRTPAQPVRPGSAAA